MRANLLPFSLRSAVMVLALCCASLQAQAARLALVVGNDAYQSVDRLKNAGNDAKLMANALRRAGFDVSEHQNLDRNRLYDVVDGFQRRVGKGDEVVFYFSGHGVQLDNDPMLLPVDIQAQDDKKLRREALPLLYVQDALKEARVSLLVIDACRDNPFPKQGTRTIGDTRGLRPPDVVKGQAVILSAGRNQKALDYVPGEPALRNGLFTHEFVRAMSTPGLDVRSALNKIRDEVEDKAAKANHPQRPSLIDDLRGNFYLLASLSPEPTGKPTPAQADPEQEAWQAAKAANNAAAYDAYLAEYPRGKYASAARIARAPVASAPTLGTPQATQPTAPPSTAAASTTAQVGSTFKDCADCPEMVVIPAGSFTMGSNDGRANEKPPHTVTLRSFALGKYEVTQGQWKALMGSNPSRFQDCGDNCPVEKVSWEDAQQYIQKLNQKTGQRYRLPSEAEWEYAARAGTTTRYWWGDTASHEYANYGKDECCDGLALGRDQWVNTAPVGRFPANAFGLYDMHGNVWEWVQDGYHDNYHGATTDGSAWESGGEQQYRVLRGGAWSSYPILLRAAYRVRVTPGNRDFNVGFRLARMLP